MIDHIQLQGQLDCSVKEIRESYKAGVTSYIYERLDPETGELYIVDTCLIRFKKLNVQCRYFERYNSKTDTNIVDYNLRGSVHRFHYGKSYCDFHYSDAPRALERFCRECYFDIQKPHRIREIELGVNIVVNDDPDDYLTMFKMYRGSGFHEMRVLSGEERPHGIERVLSDMYSIKIYNKTCYSQRVERKKPKSNILRIEIKFESRAIKYYNLPTTIQELCDKLQFQKYVDRFWEIINTIKIADCSPDVSSLKGKVLREYYFMHGDMRTYSEYLRKIRGNRKAVELEKNKYNKINAILEGLPTKKDEVTKKLNAKVRKLMK